MRNSEWLIITSCLLFLIIGLVFWIVEDAQAQLAQSDNYILLYRGVNGLHFDCVDEYPYDNIRRMEWNSTDGFTEITDFRHYLSIVAVTDCNLDNVYTTENNGTFVWRMTNRECELNVCAAHVNRGAFWIEAK
jgi:hypothetical protein